MDPQVLLSLLECPVCYKVPNTSDFPVFCKNGHIICGNCKTNVKKCPTCREEMLKTRFNIMFQIIDAILVPCENKLAGCKTIMNLNEKEEHMKNCEFRSLACKIGCCKTLTVILKNEIKEKHQRRAGIYEIGPSEINNQNFWIKEDGSRQAIWFHPSQKLWVIGPKDRLGTSTGSLVSLTDEKTRCPLDMKKGWMFKSEKGWVDASKDIKIGCGKGSNCVHRFADDKEIRILEEGDFEDKIQIQIMDNIFNFDLMGIANSIRRLPLINTIGGILMCVINSLKWYEIF